jgi:hypothetical protein
MAGITLAQAEAQLALWLDADASVATRQSYSIAGRSLTRADAAQITAKIKYWEAKIQRLTNSNGGTRVRQGVPVD